jgi:hypothetical protein
MAAILRDRSIHRPFILAFSIQPFAFHHQLPTDNVSTGDLPEAVVA